jgi:T5SS/PEP-CTERM-associated repeat protein
MIAAGTLRLTTGRLWIGRDGEGRFDQEAGTVTVDDRLTLGAEQGSDGHYEKGGGTLLVGNPIEVGTQGIGQLVQNSGSINAPLMYVGLDVDSTGLFRSLGGETDLDGALDVGRAGQGMMRVLNGSSVSNFNGTLGVDAGSDGMATVSGADSSWVNRGFLRVAQSGAGTLNVSAGASVSSQTAVVGYSGGSNGSATFQDAGTEWSNENDMTIGRGGIGNLTILNRGNVTTNTAILGALGESTGTVNVTGTLSKLTVNGDLTVGSDGTANLTISQSGTVTSARGFVGSRSSGDGVISITGFNTKWISDSVYVGGSATQGGGTGVVNVNDEGRFIVDSLTIWDSGTVNVTSGQLTAAHLDTRAGGFNLSGGFLSLREVTGSLVDLAGRVRPFGDSLGVATVSNGSYGSQPGATLEIGIDGAGAGQFDSLSISGSASLAGDLEIGLLGGFVPDVTDTFTVLSALGGLSGAFSNVLNGMRLSTIDDVGSFIVNYGSTSAFNPNEVVLSNFIQILAGDFNHDGNVGAADYVVWRNNLGTTYTEADYNVWRDNFGRSAAGAAAIADSMSTSGVAHVPEPTGMVLFVIGPLLVIMRVSSYRDFILHPPATRRYSSLSHRLPR